METRDPEPSPPGLVSQDDSGLWMKTDSDTVTDHKEGTLLTCGEVKVTAPAPALITRYYSVMDDVGADDVFIPPPPPSYTAPLLPVEGSSNAIVNNPSMTLTNGPADAIEANANPSGLDWHHGEKQLMAEHNKADEGKASTGQTSKESMDTVSPSKDKESTPPKDQTSMEDSSSLMETCSDRSERYHPDNTAGDEESKVKPEIILSGGQENWRETQAERDKYLKDVLTRDEENSGNETYYDKERDIATPGEICGLGETDSKLTSENVDCGEVEPNTQSPSNLSVDDDDFESCGPPELCKCNQNKLEAATNHPQVQPENPSEVYNDDGEHVDTRPLDYNHTKYTWVRRESGSSETQLSELPISEGFEETMTKGEQGDGSRRIATDIQQGEQLLQRLQQVQIRQDVCISESPDISQQIVLETRDEEKGERGTEVDDLKEQKENLTGGDEKEVRSHTFEDKEGKKQQNEKNEYKISETKSRMSLSTIPAEPEHNMIDRREAGDSDDDQSDSQVPANLSTIDPHETSSTQIPFPSTRHRFSATEATIERQLHEAAQERQNLQRASGLFNLADNPDVLEIPFKTNISLEPLATMVSPGQRSDWQFSEQKMQKEISQDIQRELVLVNQGKIPGGYSKGEIRQLKETKLLFEAFQQDNSEGPTRYHKSATALMKGHVYPSVLERTRSLEMFSLKSQPISRTHSLRLYKSTFETEKSPDSLRSKSPTGGSRDKTRLFPYPKQDKHTRMYKSMDSISNDTSVGETGDKTRQRKTTQESPILRQNPFYKLRPALALQPEVEKDIREAKEREEELRRQRCTLYGENRQNSEDGEKSLFTATPAPDDRRQSRGKLERVWPPPSKKDAAKSEQSQQEPKAHRAGGQKAPLWQRWESGLVNGQPPKENN